MDNADSFRAAAAGLRAQAETKRQHPYRAATIQMAEHLERLAAEIEAARPIGDR